MHLLFNSGESATLTIKFKLSSEVPTVRNTTMHKIRCTAVERVHINWLRFRSLIQQKDTIEDMSQTWGQVHLKVLTMHKIRCTAVERVHINWLRFRSLIQQKDTIEDMSQTWGQVHLKVLTSTLEFC